MGLLWQTTVPGRGAQRVWYDHKFRPVASSDGNGRHILNEYDDRDRVWKTYLQESGFSLSGSGISNDDLSSHFTADKLLSAVTYAGDGSTWVTNSENRLLEATTPNPPIMVVSDNHLANISRRCDLLIVLLRILHDFKVEKYYFFYFFVVARGGKCTVPV
ncbi:MAG: hypothetical protein KF852_15090 [Saprospiraceae bacterium]|nr:hypothetical protein [Saprospiraceae bacterium]